MNFRSAILILGFNFLKSLYMPVSSTDYLHNPLGQNDLQSFTSCDWVIESLALSSRPEASGNSSGQAVL